MSDEKSLIIKTFSKSNNVNMSDEVSTLQLSDQSNPIKSFSKHNNEDESFRNMNEDNPEQNSLNEIENWRCKIKREASRENNETHVSTRPKPNYLTPCIDWDFNNTNKAIGLPI